MKSPTPRALGPGPATTACPRGAACPPRWALLWGRWPYSPFCTLDAVQPPAAQTSGQVNDENRRPQRRRSGESCCLRPRAPSTTQARSAGRGCPPPRPTVSGPGSAAASTCSAPLVFCPMRGNGQPWLSLLLTGNRRTRNRSRGQSRPTNVKENTIKFEGDFDFESANAQFNREELDKEFKKKLNFKGLEFVPTRQGPRSGSGKDGDGGEAGCWSVGRPRRPRGESRVTWERCSGLGSTAQGRAREVSAGTGPSGRFPCARGGGGLPGGPREALSRRRCFAGPWPLSAFSSAQRTRRRRGRRRTWPWWPRARRPLPRRTTWGPTATTTSPSPSSTTSPPSSRPGQAGAGDARSPPSPEAGAALSKTEASADAQGPPLRVLLASFHSG